MKLAALDTSTEYCSVALLLDGTISARQAYAGQEHSALLLPMLDELLRQAGIKIAALDGIAFGAGPGSFTGLRIACGVAQGLAFGAGLPVAGVSTLLALAQAAAGARVAACLDARMGEVYHAAYEKRGGAWMTVCAPVLCRAEDAPELPGGEWVGCGSGFALYGEALAARYAGRLARIEAGLVPHAREIAVLAAPLFAQGLGVAAEQAEPLYVRDKVALKTGER